MPDEPSRWQSDALAVEADLRAWRAAHPDATLTEIEAALDARLRGARAGLLVDVAAGAPDGDADRCPACGERLVRRGERTRTLRTQARRRWRCGGRT